MREIELKLDLAEAAAEALLASAILPGEPVIHQLRAIYHDTPGHALARAGLSLRIRTDGDARIQTVKADGGGGGAGLFLRSEWERPVDDDRPVLDNTTPVRAMLGKRVKEIAPVFAVEVERRTWIVQHDDAEIEVVLDRGAARAGDLQAPICEVELELKAGAPAALFALARQLDAVAPLRLGVLAKAERGYRLPGKARTAFKAEPVVLTPAMDAADAFGHVAHACLRQFRLNEAVLLDTPNAEALHQARVALRRLRSAFTIFRPLHASDDSAAALRAELRWLAGELGQARDRDVLLARAPAGELQDRIQAARDDAYAAVVETLASPRVRGMMLDLAEWLSDGPWLGDVAAAGGGEPARDFAVAALDRFRRKMKKQGRDLEDAGDHVRHDVRKDAKKLRYASAFFAALFDRKRERRRYKRFVAALEELQDRLGALNDLATAPQLIHALGLADAPGADALLATGKRKALIAAAAEVHADLIDAKRFWR